MKSRCAVVFAILGISIALAACGGSGGDSTALTESSPTTETSAESSATEARIKEVERETEEAELEAALAKKEVAQQAAREKQADQAEEAVSEPPDVIGMRLPEAESTLRAAGFRTQAENTDTVFGIVVKSHYTICTESEPHGDVVTVLAQKYGC